MMYRQLLHKEKKTVLGTEKYENAEMDKSIFICVCVCVFTCLSHKIYLIMKVRSCIDAPSPREPELDRDGSRRSGPSNPQQY